MTATEERLRLRDAEEGQPRQATINELLDRFFFLVDILIDNRLRLSTLFTGQDEFRGHILGAIDLMEQAILAAGIDLPDWEVEG